MSRALMLRLGVRSLVLRDRSPVPFLTMFAPGKLTRVFVRVAAFASLLLTITVALTPQVGHAQEERQRRNLFGMHNLKDGGPDFAEGMEWTQHLVGRGFVFDWVTDITPWIETAFRLNLIPCIRVQEGRGGAQPDPGYAGGRGRADSELQDRASAVRGPAGLSAALERAERSARFRAARGLRGLSGKGARRGA